MRGEIRLLKKKWTQERCRIDWNLIYYARASFFLSLSICWVCEETSSKSIQGERTSRAAPTPAKCCPLLSHTPRRARLPTFKVAALTQFVYLIFSNFPEIPHGPSSKLGAGKPHRGWIFHPLILLPRGIWLWCVLKILSSTHVGMQHARSVNAVKQLLTAPTINNNKDTGSFSSLTLCLTWL